MALKNVATWLRFFVVDTATGLGVPGLTVGGGSFSSIKLSQDGSLAGGDIKGSISLVDEGTGWYNFAVSALQMNKTCVSPVVVPATVTYQGYGVTVYTEATGDAYSLLNGTLGADSKVKLSTDAQDLSATLSVNAKLLNGATPNNLSQTQVTGGAYALSTDTGGAIKISVGTGTGQLNLSTGKVPATVAATDVSGNPNVTVNAYAVNLDPASQVLANPSNPLDTDNSGKVSLTTTGLDAILIDGKTLPTAITVIASTTAGKVSGAGTGTEVFKGIDGSTTRVTSTVDSNGNRTNVYYS
jgi:hypothetical protein